MREAMIEEAKRAHEDDLKAKERVQAFKADLDSFVDQILANTDEAYDTWMTRRENAERHRREEEARRLEAERLRREQEEIQRKAEEEARKIREEKERALRAQQEAERIQREQEEAAKKAAEEAARKRMIEEARREKAEREEKQRLAAQTRAEETRVPAVASAIAAVVAANDAPIRRPPTTEEPLVSSLRRGTEPISGAVPLRSMRSGVAPTRPTESGMAPPLISVKRKISCKLSHSSSTTL